MGAAPAETLFFTLLSTNVALFPLNLDGKTVMERDVIDNIG